MDWTLPRVIGHNVRARRDALGMTAATLGTKMGAVVGKDGKAWPRQTVSMLESGERAMVAAEVAALAHILGTTVADLFTPPANVEVVTVGTLEIPAEDLAAPVGGNADTAALSDDLRAIDRARAEILAAVNVQDEVLSNARAALRGEQPVELEEDTVLGRFMTARRAVATRYYEDRGPLRFEALDETEDDSGEGQ